MFRLTREVRFAINFAGDDQFVGARPTNGFGGYPSLTGFGSYMALDVTLQGDVDRRSAYLRNIKEIDDVVRRRAIPFLTQRLGLPDDHVDYLTVFQAPAELLHRVLHGAFPGAWVHEARLQLTPLMSVSCLASEHPMVRLTQTFEFCAAHRLHNPALSEEENRAKFGKCNNPHGHGHNYQVQVTLRGAPDGAGMLLDVPTFERIVTVNVIDRFDHKNLNTETAEFRDGSGLIPSVENIAMVIYKLLEPQFMHAHATLASVTVHETPKTWCEYSED
jgi:6-pyruvoyltetrahydropterin/6-carboxytetrahydropterin synthase